MREHVIILFMRGWFVPALAVMCSPAAPIHTQPPPPTEAGVGDGGVMTFAIDSLSLGDLDDAGRASNVTWAAIGYDLDGKITAKHSTDVCTLHTGALTANQVDGVGGIDNGFGCSVVPILSYTVNPTCWACDAGPRKFLSNVETQDIQAGAFTLQIQINGLSDDSTQDATGLTAQLFTSDAFDGTSAPSFDSTTDWPVQVESLVDPTSIAAGAVARFQNAYVTHGTFVAGMSENVTVRLHAEIGGIPFTIAIHDALLTFDHSTPNEAANGVLAGVLDLEEFIAVFKGAIGQTSPSLCGSAFDGIADQLRQSADILANRANTSGTPCTAISVGIGFHARRVGNPTKIGPPPASSPDPCDAGLD